MHHSRLERRRVDVEADVLRAFTAIDEEAHATAGAVIVSLAFIPQELACESVELVSGGAFREHGRAEGYVALEHKREVVLCSSAGVPRATVRVMSVVP